MRFPSNVVGVARTVVRGPHPIARYQAGAVDVAAGRRMAGANGRIRIGEPSSWSRKYSGELGPLQKLIGVGATPSLKHSPNTALPNTHGPVTQRGRVMDLLERMP